MANKLLSSGSLITDHVTNEPEEKIMTENKPVERCFLYSTDCPTGKISEGADAIAVAKKDGWLDSPAKLDTDKKRPVSNKKGKKSGGTGAANDDHSK